jgi:hypothetical protein
MHDDVTPVPRFRLQWPDNLGANLGIAGIVGVLYAMFLMGPGPLNPRNVGWLTPDPAYHQIAWEMFRQDPHWHWPLGYTDRLGYPTGESIAIVDLNPLIAILLKPLSPLLPEPFQYLGPEVALACVLLLFFALRLFRLLLGPDPLRVLLPSLFFLISPPLTYRFTGHYSLSNHWLIVAALYLFFRAHLDPAHNARRLALPALILGGAAVGINPYLAFQVLVILVTTLVSLVWRKTLAFRAGAAILGGLAAVCLAVAYAFGFFIPSGRGYAGGGYGHFSMNLLSPLDPYGYGSVLFPALPQFTAGQYEGYNYLGGGVILLLALVCLLWWRRRLPWPNISFLPALLLCCGFFTVMALSTKISIGSRLLVDLDPHEHFTRVFAPLRATGRLFWTPYYAILTGVLAIPFLLFRERWANLLVAAALLLQVADTAPLRRWVHDTVNQPHVAPLRSPVWATLGSRHQNLIVLPAWQCDNKDSPGGSSGYRIFGFLAASQRMRINSYQSARYNEDSRDFQCTEAITVLAERPLVSESAYVVTPVLAALIAGGPTGPGRCHEVDHFILCSSKTDFGLAASTQDFARHVDGVANAGFEGGSISPWTRFQAVHGDLTTVRAHSGRFSLAESVASGSFYQDVVGLQPGRRYAVTAWESGSRDATATAQIGVFDPGANMATFSRAVVAGERWQFLQDTVTVSASGVLRIHFFRNQGSGTVYWDDVTVYEDSTSGLDAAILNAGFEDAVTLPWIPFQEVRAEVTASRAHSGTRSLAETAGSGSLYQDVSDLQPGQTYTITAWASAAPGTTATAQIAVFDPGADKATFSPAATPGNGWQLFEDTVAVSSKGVLRIHLFRNPGSGIVYWDDVGIALAQKTNANAKSGLP